MIVGNGYYVEAPAVDARAMSGFLLCRDKPAILTVRRAKCA